LKRKEGSEGKKKVGGREAGKEDKGCRKEGRKEE
jgi:hypothetical protein